MAALGIVPGASTAAGPLPLTLAAPPSPGTPVASALRDALTAIEQANTANPAAAQAAAFSYNAAIEQYRAHAYERARQSALTAIRQATAPRAPAPAAVPWVGTGVFPGPRYHIIGYELPATSANAQRYVTLAHRAMAGCPALPVAAADYRDALGALNGKRYRVAMADARNIVDECAQH